MTSRLTSPLPRTATPAFWGLVQVALLIMVLLRLGIAYNSPYLDECDYIFVGRALLSGEPWITKTYMFSSDMHLYLYGLADRILTGEKSYLAARGVASVLGVISLWFFYGFVRNLFTKNPDSKRIAEISTVLFALSVPHTFISQFATYDVVCFFFFSAALWLLSKAVFTMHKETASKQVLMLLLGSALFAFAVLAKYIAVAYFPLLFVALLLLNRRAGLVFLLMVGVVLGAYILINRAELLQLYQNQLLGTHKANATVWKLLATISEYAALTAVCAAAIVAFWREKTLSSWFYAGLVVFAVPLAAYHLRSGDIISLYKHVLYVCCFLAPIAGEALYCLLRRASERESDVLRAVAGMVIIVASALLWLQLREVHNAYPNTDAMTRFVRKNLTPQTTILSEDAYLFRYACFPAIPTKNLEEMTWFDNNLDGKREAQDVIDAVWEGKFEYVYLNGLILRELGEQLQTGVLRRKYDLVMQIPYTNSAVMNPINTGFLSLYRRRSR
ncbi:MAG: glycosyltransferase family 39 protein [Candidatus Kapabacteria bacterium]|nr:glycosyltransferase family 39 protein [Candidatus Kapabacteria bacterium]